MHRRLGRLRRQCLGGGGLGGLHGVEQVVRGAAERVGRGGTTVAGRRHRRLAGGAVAARRGLHRLHRVERLLGRGGRPLLTPAAAAAAAPAAAGALLVALALGLLLGHVGRLRGPGCLRCSGFNALLRGPLRLGAVLAAAPATAAATAAARLTLLGLGRRLAGGRDLVGIVAGQSGGRGRRRRLVLLGVVHADGGGAFLGHRRRRGAGALDPRLGAVQRVVRLEQHADAPAALDVVQPLALLVEQVERDRRVDLDRDLGGAAAGALLLDRAQHRDGRALQAAHRATPQAVRAGHEGRLVQRGTQPLARQLQQAEMADAADLDARAVMPQRILQPLLDRRVVARAVHVDVVDDDEAGEVAQPQLPGDLVRGLQVGAQRRVLDRALAGGAAGIHVDGDQRLGLVDDDVAARLQLHGRLVHRVQLLLGAEAAEQRHGAVAVGADLADVLRHQHAHELARLGVGLVALDQDLVHVAGVAVADGALDEVGFLVDQRRRGTRQRALADAVPQAQQVLAVAPDLGLGPLGAGGADDEGHAVGHLQLVDHLAQAAAVAGGGDLAGDAAAARRVGHQHREAAGQRDVGGQRGALRAALLLHHLDQHDLAALDDLLDLVVAQEARRLAAAGAFVLALGDVAVRIGGAVGFGCRGIVGGEVEALARLADRLGGRVVGGGQ